MPTTNPRAGQTRPHRFEPVLYDDEALRITFEHPRVIDAATLTLGTKKFDFVTTPTALEVVVSAASTLDIPDRAPARIDVVTRNGDGVACSVCAFRGYVVRSRT